jgi:hypothetical protein
MATKWDELDDYYSKNTPAIVGEVKKTPKGLSQDDFEQIFRGRPLADAPRTSIQVIWKAGAPASLDKKAREKAKQEGLPLAALIRKAVAAYIAQ